MTYHRQQTRRSRAGRLRAGGFSILELVIALAVVSAALTIAAALVADAQRRSLTEQSRLVDPDVSLALRQLQNDVRRASTGGGDVLREEPLTLRWPDGVRIDYELVGTDLRRTMSEPEGERVVLTGVGAFVWLWLPTDKPSMVIEVQVETTRLPGAAATGGRRNFVNRGTDTRRLVLTLRGGGGVGW